MFEDKHMFKFFCALLGFASIIIPGPIVPMISFVIVIGMLIYKIKCAKESPEGFESLMLDIILIIIILFIDIGFFAMRVSAEYEFHKYNDTSSSQEMTASEFAKAAITNYQLENFSQFLEDKNHVNSIKSGFTTYLKEELGIDDINVQGNRIICTIETDTIIFTVIKNDIKYSIKET